MYEGLEDNKNAEKWTIEVAEKFMQDALVLSYDSEYDFIGEIAQNLKVDKGTFDYLIEKFPVLKRIKSHILSNCETNCFRSSKKGKINIAVGIVNLKSNHGWTDRVATDNKTEKIVHNYDYSQMSNETLKEIARLKTASESDTSESGTL